MRIIFMGTPAFAANTLKAIVANGFKVVAVVTQCDKPRDRGGKIQFCETKNVAIELGLNVLQFGSIRKEGVEQLKELEPDIIVTAAYGQILSQEIIDIPKIGILNVHASLLPKYRGSSPIQWAIMNGEKRTGVTIMMTDIGLDTGDILSSEEIEIQEDDTSTTMFAELSELGAQLLIRTLRDIESGKEIVRMRQNSAQATHYPMLTKADGLIDWSKSNVEIYNKIKALDTWPVAYTEWNGSVIKIWKAKINNESLVGDFGQIVSTDKRLLVKCGAGNLEILELQLPNKNRVAAKDFLMGRKIAATEVLGK